MTVHLEHKPATLGPRTPGEHVSPALELRPRGDEGRRAWVMYEEERLGAVGRVKWRAKMRELEVEERPSPGTGTHQAMTRKK